MTARSSLSALTRRVETATLLALILVAGGIWAFFALASEMLEGELHAFDETVLLALRTPGDPTDPIGGPRLEVAMRDLTALGGAVILTLITACVVFYLLLARQRGAALLLALTIAGGSLVSTLFKMGFDRPRPDLVPHGTEVLTASFPSGHSMMAAVTYLTLAVMLARAERARRIKVFYLVVAMVVTMLVGVSRVYLGVHWPSDVLAGWALGAAWALGVWLIARALERRGQIEPEKGS
ncbi:phosphatase PAP2 family protein [Pseudooceanicola sp. LIPI14-2-Ac024]|uniref:phosphatase PAP2 family protein n=1 Tax=Pseudooceanicola sp. LIPI14-2-Ac024 TaxID=3344875 RepID=UPI0035CFFB48